MKVPSRNIAGWARELITMCTPSRVERIQRGAAYRNLYLTGDPNGENQTFNKTFAHIDNLSSYLYSPVELRFRIEKYGAESLVDRAKFRAASSELHRQIRNANVDTAIENALTWGLVKGKSFIKLGWSEDGFEPRLVQPELMGVLEENLDTLDKQEAFVHTIYVTPTRFQQLVEDNPDRSDLMTKAAKHIGQSNSETAPDQHNMLRQVVVGGLNPYQPAGGPASTARGVVNWMSNPNPTFSPRLLAKMIAIDELWVWDSDREDWTTIQLVGDDCLLTGGSRNRNIFADPFDPDNNVRRLKPSNSGNPLAGHHPFVEFCAQPLDSYFWGLSEIHHIALLQESLNKRIDGINMMLRLQEKPPRFFSNMVSINQTALSKLNKPGGYLSDPNPNAKVQDLAPKIPDDIWHSRTEIEAMFDQIGGFAPVLQGRGESGVRAQGHAETLVRTASPRFKDRALLIERQVEELGGLALDMMKAKWVKPITAWVPGNVQSIETILPSTNELDMPPVEGQKPIEFLMYQLGDAKLVVDSHSSSPAFSHEARELAFQLAKTGAVTPTELISMTHPPHEDSLITEAERREQQKAKLVAEHPELAFKPQQGRKR